MDIGQFNAGRRIVGGMEEDGQGGEASNHHRDGGEVVEDSLNARECRVHCRCKTGPARGGVAGESGRIEIARKLLLAHGCLKCQMGIVESPECRLLSRCFW